MLRHYLFADESGNQDFSRGRGASRYFAVGTLHLVGDDSVAALRGDLLRLSTELGWRGVHDCGHFHATVDKQAVRDCVSEVIQRHRLHMDVTVIDKPTVPPVLRCDQPTFFGYVWQHHFAPLLELAETDELLVAVAATGTKRLRAAFRAALDAAIGGRKRSPCVIFAPAASDPALQASDYLLWAVMREVERGDPRAVDPLRRQLRSLRVITADDHDHY